MNNVRCGDLCWQDAWNRIDDGFVQDYPVCITEVYCCKDAKLSARRRGLWYTVDRRRTKNIHRRSSVYRCWEQFHVQADDNEG